MAKPILAQNQFAEARHPMGGESLDLTDSHGNRLQFDVFSDSTEANGPLHDFAGLTFTLTDAEGHKTEIPAAVAALALKAMRQDSLHEINDGWTTIRSTYKPVDICAYIADIKAHLHTIIAPVSSSIEYQDDSGKLFTKDDGAEYFHDNATNKDIRLTKDVSNELRNLISVNSVNESTNNSVSDTLSSRESLAEILHRAEAAMGRNSLCR